MKMSLLWVIISNFKLHPITFSWSWKRLHSYNYPIRIFNIFHISLVKCVPVNLSLISLHDIFIQTSPILNSIRKTVVDTCLFQSHQECCFCHTTTNERCRIWGTLTTTMKDVGFEVHFCHHHWSAKRIIDDDYSWGL